MNSDQTTTFNILQLGVKIIEQYKNENKFQFLLKKRMNNNIISEECKTIKENNSSCNSDSGKGNNNIGNKNKKLIKKKICKKKNNFSKKEGNCLCVKCLKRDHNTGNCPNFICKLCHQKSHRESKCPLRSKNKNISEKLLFSMKIPMCNRCHNRGHLSSDCLINPEIINISNNKNEPLCKFCNSPNHYICPFTDNFYIISDNELDNINIKNDYNMIDYSVNLDDFNSIIRYFNKEEKKIIYSKKQCINDVKKEEIKNTIFCCRCGGLHHISDCAYPKIIMENRT